MSYVTSLLTCLKPCFKFNLSGDQCLLKKNNMCRRSRSEMLQIHSQCYNCGITCFSSQYLQKFFVVTELTLGFPDSSVGKESACNAGDAGLIPGSGRSAGEGIGYPLQYSGASLITLLVKNPCAVQETWV